MTINTNVLESLELANGTTLYVQAVSNKLYLTTNAEHIEVVVSLTKGEMKDLIKALTAVMEQSNV